jgi:hypothetical protein
LRQYRSWQSRSCCQDYLTAVPCVRLTHRYKTLHEECLSRTDIQRTVSKQQLAMCCRPPSAALAALSSPHCHDCHDCHVHLPTSKGILAAA